MDAISPHKFLGGPGSSGVLIFNKRLYKNAVPDNAGGGTVSYTNPWGDHDYFDDIETREDGGTPAFTNHSYCACRSVKRANGNRLYKGSKDEMNIKVFQTLEAIPNVKI